MAAWGACAGEGHWHSVLMHNLRMPEASIHGMELLFQVSVQLMPPLQPPKQWLCSY